MRSAFDCGFKRLRAYTDPGTQEYSIEAAGIATTMILHAILVLEAPAAKPLAGAGICCHHRRV